MEKHKLYQSKPLELSVIQKRLFFLNEIARNTVAYNMPFIIKIRNGINRDKLYKLIEVLVRKHESLRTVFRLVKNVPYQFVLEKVSPEIEFYKKNKHFSTKEIITDFIKPFKLSEKTPFRVGVFEINDKEHLLIIDAHQILMDTYAQRILVKQLAKLYVSEKLYPESFQFKDYLKTQKTSSHSTLRNKQRTFWINKFKENPEKLDLPLDFSRPLLKNYRAGKVSVKLNSGSFSMFRQTAKELETELFDLVLATFNILLAKISNQEDISIGTIIDGRENSELKNVIGNLANTLVLRNRLDGGIAFSTFLHQVKTNTAKCLNNQAYKYEELLEDLSIDRTINRNPLFDVSYQYKDSGKSVVHFSNTKWEVYKYDRIISKVDLALIAEEYPDKLMFHFEYATDLFKEETITRFATYFMNIIKTVLADSKIKICEIDILSKAEKNKLLKQYNDTYSKLPENKTLLSLFEDQVNRNSGATAIIYEERYVQYGELNERIEKLAGFLKENGLKKGDLLAALTHRTPDYVVIFLAAIKNEATFLPLDTAYPNERINYILSESKVSFLIGNDELLKEKEIDFRGIKICLEASASLILKAAPLKKHPTKYNECLYVIFTSGTTGFPKGVVNTETGLLNRLYWGWKLYGYGKKEICCQKTGIGFADHIAEIFSPLLKGVPLIFIKDEISKYAESLAASIDKKRITRIVLVPSLLKILIKLKINGKASLETLKYVFSSGDSLTVQLANEFYNQFQTARLINLYGSSEVSADVTFYEVPRFRVEHILSYFKNLTETEKHFRYLNNRFPGEKNEEFFTTPNIALMDIAENFKVSKVSERLISLEEYYRRLEEEVIPYSINTASPAFIGHMTSALPDFVHEMSKLISQMNQNQVKIETSKSFTLLEREAIAMLHRLFYRMPNNFYEENIQKVNTNLGIVASGGTTANISAILAARNRALFRDDSSDHDKDKNIYDRLKELGYKDMVIIGSELMHYSFKKTASLLGFGANNILHAPNNKDGVMSVKGLKDVIRRCKEEKLLIIAVIGIAGSTERGSIDPLKQIARITRENQLHFHVDAAWGGALMFSKKYNRLLKGIENASSITICGHKQLFLPQGISVCLFKDVKYLTYNSVTANYQAQQDTFDFGRFTLEGSRPALSLCLHAALRILGTKGYELLINNGIEKANMFAKMIQTHEAFELLSCQINILNYRYIPERYRNKSRHEIFPPEINEEINLINKKIQQEQFTRGKTFVSKTTIKDVNSQAILVFRTVISNPLTTKRDFISVLNDQITIINELFGEENRYVTNDAEHIRMETEYETNRQKETSVSIGKPLQNVQILILDNYGNLQPEGVSGEICIGGLGLAKEYLNNQYETKTSFVTSKLLEGRRIYKSGDLGRWNADGYLEYLGRKDDQVKIQGYRIELDEIVYHLNAFKPIDQSIVIAQQLGNEKYLVAYYVAKEEIKRSEIVAFLSERLPSYMIPSFFVFLTGIPLNSNGKVAKTALPNPKIKSRNSICKPETNIETALTEIWSEILSLAKDAIGTDINFFEIGGSSLLLIELTHKINERFNLKISAREIILKPTIKQQAGVVSFILN